MNRVIGTADLDLEGYNILICGPFAETASTTLKGTTSYISDCIPSGDVEEHKTHDGCRRTIGKDSQSSQCTAWAKGRQGEEPYVSYLKLTNT
jgi:hypothetical protein